MTIVLNFCVPKPVQSYEMIWGSLTVGRAPGALADHRRLVVLWDILKAPDPSGKR